MTYTVQNSTIQVKLPVTHPTGMVRVKKRQNIFNVGAPVATRQNEFSEDLYLEWQIAYDTKDIHKSVQKILFIRYKLNDEFKERRATYELSDLLYEAIKLDILPGERIQELITFGSSIKEDEYIEVNILPVVDKDGMFSTHQFQFIVCYEKRPILLYQLGNTCIELVVKPKQRAVGMQIMLFFDIPVAELEEWENLKGRTAYANEEVTYVINKNNSIILIEIVKCFMLSSKQHNSDLLNILQAFNKALLCL